MIPSASLSVRLHLNLLHTRQRFLGFRERHGRDAVLEFGTGLVRVDTRRCDSLALLNSGKIELPDIPRVINQICGLERKVSRGGRDSIDHAPGGHDDFANSVLLAALLAHREGGRPRISATTIDMNPRSSNAITNWLA
jgi:hypothetical protein